jgi:DNA-binding NarL/FixJ family response regulator
MARHRKSNYQFQLELMIKEAVRTLRCLPIKGLAPAQYRSCMPEIVRTLRDMDYPPDRTKLGRFAASRAAISRLDRMLVAIAGADLTALQRDIVWDRAEGKPVKVIAVEQGIGTRTVERHHANALAEIAAYLIAASRKPLAGKTLALKRRIAA